MREVIVVGTSITKFGVSKKTNLEQFSEAALECMHSSNLYPKEIEALYFSNVFGDFEESQSNMAPLAAAQIGLRNVPCTRFEAACASATVAFRAAYMAVAGGFYDTVLVGGTERAAVLGTSFGTRIFATASDCRYESFSGITFPGVFALAANRYSSKYELPPEVLEERMAYVAVKNHANALHNPKAHMHKRITVDDVLKSPKVADPLKLYDCCPFSDGGAAAILTTAEKGKKLTDAPIYVAGTGLASNGPLSSQPDLTRITARELAAKQSYRQAGMTPKDIDLVELHDCFTIAEILAIEGLGFYRRGDGHRAAFHGETHIGGKIPVNPSGGLKAKGHPIGATGLAQVHEVVTQLRGEAEKRQVDGADVGMVDTLGGDFSIVCNVILKRD